METLGVKPGAEIGKAMRWLQDQADELAAQGQTLTPELAKELLRTKYPRAASVVAEEPQYLLYGTAVYRRLGTAAFPHFRASGVTWEDAQRVIAYLMDLGVNPIIIGGVAVKQHGYERETGDIDILISREDYDTLSDGNKLEQGPDGERLAELPGIDVLYEGDYWDHPSPEAVRKPGTHLPTFEGLLMIKLKSGRQKDTSDVTELLKRTGLSPALKKQLDRYFRRNAPELLDDLEGWWTVAEVEVMKAEQYRHILKK